MTNLMVPICALHQNVCDVCVRRDITRRAHQDDGACVCDAVTIGLCDLSQPERGVAAAGV